VTRRTLFDLFKARDRAHILEGLAVALANIDAIIALIKAASSPVEAKTTLMARVWAPGGVIAMLEGVDMSSTRPEWLDEGFGLTDTGYRLSEAQAQAILDLRLHRLTGLEQEKIITEYKTILKTIEELLFILSSHERLMEVIRNELIASRDEFGDPRRTEIMASQQDLTLEDLISEEDVVVTLSHEGYAKAQPLSSYQAQRRGGRGKSATSMKDEDFIEQLFVANTHDTILCFSTQGKVYWKKVYELPQASRNARGKPIVNLLPLDENERITAVLPVRDYEPGQFVLMATRRGIVKKTPLTDFSRPRTNGIIAIDLPADDSLIGVDITDGSKDILLTASNGKAVRFNEANVRPMGRVARGVRGIRIDETHDVISLIIVDEGFVLTVTEMGYGKRTPIDEYPVHGRGGQGVISIQTSKRNGAVVGARLVGDDDEIMMITDGGTLVRTRVNEISIQGRNTQGVTLIRLDNGELVVGLDRFETLEDEANGKD